MAESDFKSIAGHLEFFGYTVVIEEGIIKAHHDVRFEFWVHPHRGGGMFLALFVLGKKALQGRPALLEFLNEANYFSNVTRFSSDEQFMFAASWFPGNYQKDSFASFFDQFQIDIAGPAIRDAKTVAALFSEGDAEK